MTQVGVVDAGNTITHVDTSSHLTLAKKTVVETTLAKKTSSHLALAKKLLLR